MTDFKRSYRETIMCDAEFKITVIGNPDIGKSSFIQRLVDNKFSDKKSPTYGMDKKVKIVKRDNKTIKFAIWDTAGQQNYRSITANFLKGTAGIFLCFDLSKMDTFMALREWKDIILDNTGPNTLVFLVGNKVDLIDKANPIIPPQEIEVFRSLNGFSKIFEVLGG